MARKKYYCVCGESFSKQQGWALHKRYNPDHFLLDEPVDVPEVLPPGPPPRSEKRPAVESPAKTVTRTAATRTAAATKTTPGVTYLRETVYVPATLRVYYDTFRGHFNLQNTFSDWLVDCVLTLIERSRYQLALVEDMDGRDLEEELHVVDEGGVATVEALGNTRELVVTKEDFEEDGHDNSGPEGNARDIPGE